MEFYILVETDGSKSCFHCNTVPFKPIGALTKLIHTNYILGATQTPDDYAGSISRMDCSFLKCKNNFINHKKPPIHNSGASRLELEQRQLFFWHALSPARAAFLLAGRDVLSQPLINRDCNFAFQGNRGGLLDFWFRRNNPLAFDTS